MARENALLQPNDTTIRINEQVITGLKEGVFVTVTTPNPLSISHNSKEQDRVIVPQSNASFREIKFSLYKYGSGLKIMKAFGAANTTLSGFITVPFLLIRDNTQLRRKTTYNFTSGFVMSLGDDEISSGSEDTNAYQDVVINAFVEEVNS